jgi:hypothetical protein
MSERPQGSVTGIFGLLFRETGLFLEQALQRADEQAKQAFDWADGIAKDDRLLDAEDQKRRSSEATARRADAEARLLEQMRLAKQAGLDVDAILARLREDKR